MLKNIAVSISFVFVLFGAFLSFANERPPLIGNGIMKSDIRKVPVFHAIQCDGAFNLTLTAGKRQHLVVKGDSNIIPEIKTDVKDGKLLVFSERSYSSKKYLELTVDVQEMDEVIMGGAFTATANMIHNPVFNVETNGAGTLIVSGTTKEFSAKINGGGTISAGKLLAERVSVDITGAGNAEVSAKSVLNANIIGSGTILYLGHPEVIQQILGIGTISQKK